MRKYYSEIFKSFFHEYILRTRAEKGMTQERMSEILAMNVRSYMDLEYSNNSCSALTLSLFLIYCCPDAGLFLQELQKAFEKEGS